MPSYTELLAFVPTQMTTAERDADWESPPNYLTIFNTTIGMYQVYTGERWVSLPQYVTVAASAAPGVGDDADDDYVIGDRWLDTTADKEYVCVDTTVGAAVWLTPVIVQDAEPSITPTGQIWLDTSTDATGTESLAVATKTTSYTATNSDAVILCDASAAGITVTLPTAVGRLGRVYNIKKIDSSSFTVTVDGDGSETIDDGTTAILTVQYESITIISDGTEWWIL